MWFCLILPTALGIIRVCHAYELPKVLHLIPLGLIALAIGLDFLTGRRPTYSKQGRVILSLGFLFYLVLTARIGQATFFEMSETLSVSTVQFLARGVLPCIYLALLFFRLPMNNVGRFFPWVPAGMAAWTFLAVPLALMELSGNTEISGDALTGGLRRSLPGFPGIVSGGVWGGLVAVSSFSFWMICKRPWGKWSAALFFLVAVGSMAAAGCVLSMESAAAHIACALGKAGVFLIGGGHFGAFAPWTTRPNQVWLTNELPCFGCDWNCVRSTPECITHVPPTAITTALNRVLLEP